MRFNLKTVTENQVRKIIKSSKNKKSHGIDKITISTIKGALNVLITPITHIVNTSISQGSFPEQWKMAKVIPLLKKGDSKNKTNYRPISLLPVTSKILEAVVRKQVSKFFETNNLLPKQQHGFRPGRSTTTALISLQEKLIKSANQGENTAMLLWDLSAAFDTLDHDIFLEKLKIYSFTPDQPKLVPILPYRAETGSLCWRSILIHQNNALGIATGSNSLTPNFHNIHG